MGNYQQDNDDNEKQSKIDRESKGFLRNAVLLVLGLTLFSLVLGYVHTHEPPKLALEIREVIDKLEQPPVHYDPNNGEDFAQVDRTLAAAVDDLDAKVRTRKATKGVIMETDTEGLQLTSDLQAATRKLLAHRYGANTQHTKFRIRVDLIYPHSIIKDPDSEPNQAHFVIELAPHDLIPCSVFYFLEIARTYKAGEFHRNANHVLQAAAQSESTKGHKSMPFQEYSKEHPHAKFTTGYAGRPSGPGWYVSIMDNTRNHGPGSQQKANPYEADSNFGRVVEGFDAVAKIHTVPQKEWLSKENCVAIPKLTILANTPEQPDVFQEWVSPL